MNDTYVPRRALYTIDVFDTPEVVLGVDVIYDLAVASVPMRGYLPSWSELSESERDEIIESMNEESV